MTACKHIYYSGNVQGVGFRYTTAQIAAGFSVTGFVRNLSDGRVEMVAQGDMSDVEAFVAAIADEMSDHITSVRSADEPPDDGLKNFRIRY